MQETPPARPPPSSISGWGRTAEGGGYPLQYSWASLVAQLVKNLPANVGALGSIPGLGRSPGEGNTPVIYSRILQKGKATHSSILVWRIPWTVKAMGSQSQTQLSDFHFGTCIKKKNHGDFVILLALRFISYYLFPLCVALCLAWTISIDF